MDSRHLIAEDYDPDTGITERFYYDNGKITIQRLQDIDEHAGIVQSLRNNAPTNFSATTNGVYAAASVPAIEVERWKTEHGFDWFQTTDNEKRKWLNSDKASHWKMRDKKL